MIIISVKYIQIHQLYFNKFNLITTSGLIGQKELHCFFIKTMLLGIHFKYTHASPFISLSFSCIHTKHNTVSFVDFIFSFGFFPSFLSPLSYRCSTACQRDIFHLPQSSNGVWHPGLYDGQINLLSQRFSSRKLETYTRHIASGWNKAFYMSSWPWGWSLLGFHCWP